MSDIENQARYLKDRMVARRPKTTTKAPSFLDGPGHDDLGRPTFYDIKQYPPGSVIHSNAGRGGVGIGNGRWVLKGDQWYDPDGNPHPTGPPKKPIVGGTPKQPARSFGGTRVSRLKQTKSRDIDPYGRTIVGDKSQLREEARRHGLQIKDGPGSD